MKKISTLLTLLLCMSMPAAFAGSFTLYNFTGCTFQLYNSLGSITDPATGTVYPFSFGPMTFAPGTVTYPNPTTLPGFTTAAPPALRASGCINGLRMARPEMPETYPGSSAVLLTNAITAYSSTNSPACNGGNNYTITWSTGANGCDIIILIF